MDDLPTLLVDCSNPTSDLIGVSERVFGALGVDEWEERASSNYPPDGHYTVGYATNVTITVCDTDDDRLIEYPFVVSLVRSAGCRGVQIVPESPSAIADILAASGFSVFIPSGPWWLADWERQGVVQKPKPRVPSGEKPGDSLRSGDSTPPLPPL